MDYKKYDELQCALCGVGAMFASEVKDVINNSNCDNETKELSRKLCEKIENSLDTLARHISDTLIAASK